MRYSLLFVALALALSLSAEDKPIGASVETPLATSEKQIRMFVYDNDENTYFASAGNVKADDHVTLVFDKPVAVKSVSVLTGRVKGGDTLDAGELQISADGKTFEKIATFADGKAKADVDNVKALAVRIKPSAEMSHPLAVREFTVVSEPPVIKYKYPVEVTVNCKECPELQEWTDKTARVCERAYQMICEELKSDGYTPRIQCSMTMTHDYDKGVAYTSGSRIVGGVKYFADHKADVGAMVHEMVHFGQGYRGRNPSWLVEGVADYIRNFKYEPEKGLRKVNPEKVKYDGSYQISARFLDFLTKTYDKDIVKKLNQAMREGKYKEELFEEYTKKKLPELDTEWKEALKKEAKS